jgi:hypothetical protein
MSTGERMNDDQYTRDLDYANRLCLGIGKPFGSEHLRLQTLAYQALCQREFIRRYAAAAQLVDAYGGAIPQTGQEKNHG